MDRKEVGWEYCELASSDVDVCVGGNEPPGFRKFREFLD
jgi:hypothetical protein